MKKIDIMGTRVDNVTMNDALSKCINAIENNSKCVVYTPNTEFVMMADKDKEFKELLNKSDINIPDGVGLILGSKIKGVKLQEKVAGYDLTVKLIEEANLKRYSIYFLGGKPGVAEQAAEKIKGKYNDVNIVGVKDGYFKGSHLGMLGHDEEVKVIDDINSKNPNILFVGFGAKKQEMWIDLNKDKLNVNVFVGNGGSVDVLAGNVKRAPDFFIKFGLEWFYRLITDPKRIKRQILLPAFIIKVIFGGKDIIKVID